VCKDINNMPRTRAALVSREAEPDTSLPDDVDPDTGEIVTSNSSLFEGGSSASDPAYRIVQHISTPNLQVDFNKPILCKIAAYARKPAPPGARYRGDADVLTIESRSGDRRNLIGNSVLVSELAKAYPPTDDDPTPFVGKWFRLTRLEKRRSSDGMRSYSTWEIVEIVLTDRDDVPGQISLPIA
jgi:hypothetical protein